MDTGVVPSSPRFFPSIFIAHRVQQSHCSSIFHRVLLTHALVLFSASQIVHKKKSQRIYTSMQTAGPELTKLTYTRLEDNLIRHRGMRIFFFFFLTFHFPASGQAVVTGVVPPPPRFLHSRFIAHRVPQSHCSSIFHRVLLTHALALSASQFVHKKTSQRIYTSMHSAGLELRTDLYQARRQPDTPPGRPADDIMPPTPLVTTAQFVPGLTGWCWSVCTRKQ